MFNFAHGLHACCVRLKLPLRVSNVTALPEGSALSSPQYVNAPASYTSLSNVPDDSSCGPIENTRPIFPVTAYTRPSGDPQNPVTCVDSSVVSRVYLFSESSR